jgi:serine phosphatase RsbU (regulator of sigma subunit)
MPIFQDPDERCKQNTRNTALTLEQQEGRRGVMRCPTEQKEEADNGRREAEEAEMEDMGDVARVESLLRRLEGARMETSDRVELIERIKRGESPTWVPGRAVSGLLSSRF